MTSSSIALAEVVQYLDGYLRIRDIPDDLNALNGLQVENAGRIGRIVAAVDASQQTIDAAVAAGTSPVLVLAHHGLFWDGNQPVAGRRYHRLKALLDGDAALYAAHLPLDAHPEVGNNAVLAKLLGLQSLTPFGTWKGATIGLAGEVAAGSASRNVLRDRVATSLGIAGAQIRVIAGGPEQVRRIGVITGAGGSMIALALESGCDTFVTGEGAAHTYFDAMEWGINVLYAGHYATETLGVRALADHLGARFHLPWEFHDHPTGL